MTTETAHLFTIETSGLTPDQIAMVRKAYPYVENRNKWLESRHSKMQGELVSVKAKCDVMASANVANRKLIAEQESQIDGLRKDNKILMQENMVLKQKMGKILILVS